MAVHNLHELVGAVVAKVVRGGASSPMFCASMSFIEVTMFQPMRPLLMWSSVMNMRATW